jgi:ribose 5-phosphate isomerase A
VVGLDTNPELDLTIDGADAVQRGSLSLIKGLGGALLREKIVATASAEMTVIVDDSKLRGPLGTFCPVPVEISQFGWQSTARKLERLGATVTRRADPAATAFVTDGGNYILDCDFGEIVDAMALEQAICGLAGVLESGLFVGIASRVIIAGANGVTVLAPEHAR